MLDGYNKALNYRKFKRCEGDIDTDMGWLELEVNRPWGDGELNNGVTYLHQGFEVLQSNTKYYKVL